MEQMIELNYYIKGEEVRPKYKNAYHDADYVIKLDCLQDAIYYLTLEYNKVLEVKNGTKKSSVV